MTITYQSWQTIILSREVTTDKQIWNSQIRNNNNLCLDCRHEMKGKKATKLHWQIQSEQTHTQHKHKQAFNCMLSKGV